MSTVLCEACFSLHITSTREKLLAVFGCVATLLLAGDEHHAGFAYYTHNLLQKVSSYPKAPSVEANILPYTPFYLFNLIYTQALSHIRLLYVKVCPPKTYIKLCLHYRVVATSSVGLLLVLPLFFDSFHRDAAHTQTNTRYTV